MKRWVSMDEISDGRRYGINDMVRVGCQDCAGCARCCHDMVKTILLYPLDAYRLAEATGKRFEELLEREAELGVVNGMVLPNLKMTEEGGCCAFLDERERCSIHPFRPDLCRLFPLGRYYENGDFFYFLQVGQCDRARTKVKVGKWIDTPDYPRNKAYVLRWHDLLERVEEIVNTCGEDTLRRNVSLALLKTFYLAPYDRNRDFYEQFDERADRMEAALRGEIWEEPGGLRAAGDTIGKEA